MRAVWTWVAVCALAACDPETKKCHELMTSAQAIVAQVDSKSVASLQQSLAAVSGAHAACEKAKLGTEREELLKAKHEITAQLNLLEQRASRKKLLAPSASELAQLVKSGDPACPKGQAYKPKGAKDEVRCTGPQVVDMGAEAVTAYYGDRHFKVTRQEAPAEVRAELGSELYVFAYDKWADAAPRCVTAYAAPGLSWQELTARLTGAPPEKLKLDAPVKSGRGELRLKVEHALDKPTVHLGNCGPSSGQIVAPP